MLEVYKSDQGTVVGAPQQVEKVKGRGKEVKGELKRDVEKFDYTWRVKKKVELYKVQGGVVAHKEAILTTFSEVA